MSFYTACRLITFVSNYSSMAISTYPHIDAFMFSSAFRRLDISGLGSAPAKLSVSSGGVELFANTYTPDADGVITVYDLDKLMVSHIPELLSEFSLYVNGAALPPSPVTVVKCDALISEPAADFLSDFFLGCQVDERDTVLGRHELLNAYSASTQEVAVAECVYLAGDGKLARASLAVGAVLGLVSLDVSPARLVSDAGRLVAYSVVCGKRRARFRVLADAPATDPSFIFRNRFGVWEILHCTGLKETNPSFTRDHAVVGGRMRPYDIKETVTFKAFTGPLRHGMEEVVMDLARSRAVFVLNPDGSAGDEVVVTDCSLKHNNDDSSLSDLSVSYRLADRGVPRIAVTRPPRLFDNTFDATYG